MAKHNREHPRSVIWVPNAYCMFDAAVAYIAEGSTTASENFVEDVLRAADQLELYGEDGRIVPELGRPELREITVGRYRLQYHLADDTAEIVALMPAR
jgi:toxin ParE1/3/4